MIHFFIRSTKRIFLCLISLGVFFTLINENLAYAHTVQDMRGISVEIPEVINRVATIDDGFIEGMMTHLGVIDKVTVIGSWSMKRDYKYTFETVEGETYEHKGLNTMKLLHPWLNDLICVNSPQGNILDYEALAKAEPDIVIMRVGDCTVGSGNKENITRTINTIESLGLPLIVLYTPNYYESSSLYTIREEARVIGDIFTQQEKAVNLADYLADIEDTIRSRTMDIPQEEKKRVLYLGLNPAVREQGGAGTVNGTDTPESYIMESVVNAINAFAHAGTNMPLSAEQIYALDPDVILLPTMNGYHPAKELYEAPYYTILGELRAIQEKQVFSMPWTPMNCARRIEYPLDMLIMAKAVYPKRFADINVYDFALEFYKKVYHVNDQQAAELRTTQILDWMKDSNF